MKTQEAWQQLQDKYGYSRDRARRLLQIAAEFGENAEPVPDGYIRIVCLGRTPEFTYSIEEHTGNRRAKVAPRTVTHYTHSITGPPRTTLPKKESEAIMPRAQAAAQEPETDEEEDKDYTVYADKAPTPTMVDFADWIVEEVYEGEAFPTQKENDAFRNGVRLGGTLRMEFQKSDMNKERRAERQAARASGNGDADEEEAEAKPVRRGRAAKAETTPAPTTTKKTARRGRPAQTAEAPY